MKKGIPKWPWIVLIIFALSVPIAIFLIWGYRADWVVFWAGYSGSILGATASLIAFYMTSRQNKEFHNDSVRKNQKENYYTRRETREQNRLQVLPFITITFSNLDTINIDLNKSGDVFDISGDNPAAYIFDSSNDFQSHLGSKVAEIESRHYNLFRLAFKNVGNGAAVNLCFMPEYLPSISNLPLGSIMPNEVKYCYILFPPKGISCDFKILFQDMQSKFYSQKFNTGFYKKSSFVSTSTIVTSKPELIKQISSDDS